MSVSYKTHPLSAKSLLEDGNSDQKNQSSTHKAKRVTRSSFLHQTKRTSLLDLKKSVCNRGDIIQCSLRAPANKRKLGQKFEKVKFE